MTAEDVLAVKSRIMPPPAADELINPMYDMAVDGGTVGGLLVHHHIREHLRGAPRVGTRDGGA